MGTFWRVQVIGKTENSIDLKVIFDHPDAGKFPDDADFAKSLLFDPDEDDRYFDDFLEKYVVYEVVRHPFNEKDAHDKVDELVLKSGIEKGEEGWEMAWDEEWRNFWKDENNLPIAKYRIWVNDEDYISEFEIDHIFESYSYSDGGPYVQGNISIDPDTL